MTGTDGGTARDEQDGPTQPRTLTSTVLRRIEHQLELAETVMQDLDASTARAIARSVYLQEGGALQRFAWWGALRPAEILCEIAETPFDLLQVRWVLALTAFVEAAERGQRRDAARPSDQPSPRVYVTRRGGLFGRWVDLGAPETEVADGLASLPPLPLHLGAEAGWQVHAEMGFCQYPVSVDDDACPESYLWRLHGVARGILRHGEAFSFYALQAPDPREEEFERCYYGQMSLEEFVLDRAEERGWLTAIDDLNEREGLRGLLSLDVERAAEHFFADEWDRFRGTDGIHVFGPPRPPS